MKDLKKKRLVSMFAERYIPFSVIEDIDEDLFDDILQAYKSNDWEQIAYILDNEF